MLVQIGLTKFEIRVEAVMSVPRLGFMDNFFCWSDALSPLGIRVNKGTGAFWGQVLQLQMERFVDCCEWILTIDYDSFFRREDVELLFAHALSYGCDAITGLQVRRSDGQILIEHDDPPENWQTLPVLEVKSAHFGLTAIRCEALKRVPKPWFQNKADEYGGWGPGKIDDDIWFWRQFVAAGCHVFVTPKVVIGHGEYMIRWPHKEPTFARDGI